LRPARLRRSTGEGIVSEEVLPVSFAEVLPDVLFLSRLDKIRLIQLLTQELEREASGRSGPGHCHPIPSPDRAYSAAAVLLQALEEDKNQS
jgi:hypothetical protein